MQRASGSRAVVGAVLCIYTIKHGYTGCIWVAMLILVELLWWYVARGCGVSFHLARYCHASGQMSGTRSGNGLLRLPHGFPVDESTHRLVSGLARWQRGRGRSGTGAFGFGSF